MIEFLFDLCKAYEDIYNYVERGFYPGSFENLGKKLLKDKREILENQSFQVKNGLLYHIPTKSQPDSIREVPGEMDKGIIFENRIVLRRAVVTLVFVLHSIRYLEGTGGKGCTMIFSRR